MGARLVDLPIFQFGDDVSVLDGPQSMRDNDIGVVSVSRLEHPLHSPNEVRVQVAVVTFQPQVLDTLEQVAIARVALGLSAQDSWLDDIDIQFIELD